MRTKFEVISVGDPAFEGLELAALRPYLRSREEKDLPALPPGRDPIVYTYRRLTTSQFFDHVESATSDEVRYRRAFAAGILSVKGGPFKEEWAPANVSDKEYIAMTEEECQNAIPRAFRCCLNHCTAGAYTSPRLRS